MLIGFQHFICAYIILYMYVYTNQNKYICVYKSEFKCMYSSLWIVNIYM